MSDVAPPLARGRRTLVIAVVAAVVLGILIGLWVWSANRKAISFSANFTSAVGVYPGSDVRMLGVPVGKVDSVTPAGDIVKVGMHLDPGYAAAASTYAVVISPNLVSDRYVALTKPWSAGAKLADKSVIGRSRTRTPVELDELTRNLSQLTTALGPNGANATGALSKLLKVGADNLEGQGAKVNQTIKDLGKSGRTLDASKYNIFATIEQLSTFTKTLQDHDSALSAVNRNFASVSQTLSDDRQTFGEALNELGTALGLVQNFVQDNRAALKSNVAKLQTVADTLADQRSSLAQALRSAPLLLDNFLNAYDPTDNLLRGRANLNEISGVGGSSGGSDSDASGAAQSSGRLGNVEQKAAVQPGGNVPQLLPGADNTATGSR